MTSRDRRALVLGLSILVAAWIVARVVPSGVARWKALGEKLEQHQLLLAETRAAISELPGMELDMRKLTIAVSRTAPQLLSGANSADALQDIAARISSIGALEHATVAAVTAVADSAKAGPLRRLTANAVLQTDFRGVARLLERLANDSVVTVVEQLRVTGSDPRAPSSAPERLQVEMRISAWFLARERDG